MKKNKQIEIIFRTIKIFGNNLTFLTQWPSVQAKEYILLELINWKNQRLSYVSNTEATNIQIINISNFLIIEKPFEQS